MFFFLSLFGAGVREEGTLCVCVCVCVCESVCLTVCPSVLPSARPSVRAFLRPSVCLCIRLVPGGWGYFWRLHQDSKLKEASGSLVLVHVEALRLGHKLPHHQHTASSLHFLGSASAPTKKYHNDANSKERKRHSPGTNKANETAKLADISML